MSERALPEAPDDKDAEILRLRKVVRVLMDRAERSTRVQSSDFGTFQMALMLEEQVTERTAQLQAALAATERVSHALQASEAELRRHRDNLSELVTEQTADLLAAKEAAEMARVLQREFLLNISHELRTPLHAIGSYAQLGQERAARLPPEKIGDYFARILQSGERLGALIDELLDLSALDAGRVRPVLQPCDLRELLAGVEQEQHAAAQAHRIRFAHTYACANPTAEIDPELLRKALRHLYANAIKYSAPDSTVEVALDEAPDALCLALRDRGPGIPDGEEEHIFHRFVQSSATRTGAGGAGAGLAIVRQIVELHGGAIRAANRTDGGAEFALTLPRRAA